MGLTHHDRSRREFMANTSKLALAATTVAGAMHLAAGATEAQTPEKKPPAGPEEKEAVQGRMVVPGSPSPAYSRAVRLDRVVFVAGCVGLAVKDGKSEMPKDFAAQARQTLLNLKASVEAAGSTLGRVLKCTCFLKEFSDFKAFNEIYMEIVPEPRPARSTVVVKDFVVPGALLEVDCVCYVD